MRTRTLVTVLLVVAVLPGAASGAVGADHAAQSDSAACSFPFSATDATGTEVTVEEAPETVVTLAPSAAQTMWEIGAREKVVGVSKYATYLQGAEARTNVSGSQSFVVVEKVVALEPDLVLAPNVISNDTVRKLREAGLTVYRFRQANSIEGVQEKTLLTGRLVGACVGAQATVEDMRSRLDTVREAIEGEDRPRVLYVFFGYTAGKGTFVHEIITAAGGENIAASANITGFKQISPEVVVKRNPEWIVVNDGAPGVPKTEAYNSTDAVRNGRIVVVQEEYISQPAPRIVRTIVKLARTFHTEAYAAANATETATATATPSPSPTTSPSPTEASAAATTAATPEPTEVDATGPDQPGFGIGAAIAALVLAAVVLARRR